MEEINDKGGKKERKRRMERKEEENGVGSILYKCKDNEGSKEEKIAKRWWWTKDRNKERKGRMKEGLEERKNEEWQRI